MHLGRVFQEQIAGPASLRMRVLIAAGNMAAMVDVKTPAAATGAVRFRCGAA